MENKSNNPPVHPIINEGSVYETGITLRDYFAAKAMQSMIANPNIVKPNELEGNFDSFSKRAYRYADSMLKNRE